MPQRRQLTGSESRYWRQRRRGWFAQGRRLLTNATRSDGGVQKEGSRLMLQLPYLHPAVGRVAPCCSPNLTYLLFQLCHSGHQRWWFHARLPLTASSRPVNVSNGSKPRGINYTSWYLICLPCKWRNSTRTHIFALKKIIAEVISWQNEHIST